MKFSPLILIFLLFTGIIFAAAKSGDPKLNQAIEKANSEWASAMKTGDAATIAAAYADDAIFVGADGACTKGRTQIEKLYAARFEKSGLAISTKIEPRNVTVDGDLAYESGYGEIGAKKDGKTAVSGGRYLTVWHNQADEWKIIRNIVLP